MKKDPILEQRRLLSMVPLGVWGVKVQDTKGVTCYRELSSVRATDVIQVKKNGEPIIMAKKPGRPPKGKKIAITSQVNPSITEREKTILSHPIVTSADEDPESLDLFDNLIKGMSHGIAALEYESKQAISQNQSSVPAISKQMIAMRSTADLWLKRRDQISTKAIDLDSRSFKELFKFIMETFRAAMKASGIRQEKIESVFGNLSDLMSHEQGWEDEATKRMKDQ